MTTALRAAIKRDSRSQPVIAKAADVDKGILSRFVRGQRSMTLDTADRVCAALGVECRLVRRRRKKAR